MKALDEDGNFKPRRPRPYKVERKPNSAMFKLRDPKTKLFWGHSRADNPCFNTTGKHWGTRKSAMRNWGDYQYQRILLEDGKPDLELIEFEVAVVEQGRSAINGIDLTLAAKVAAVLGSKAGRYSLDTFLRDVAVKTKFKAAYVIEAEMEPTDIASLPIPDSIKFQAHMHDWGGGFSGPKTAHLLIALKSLTDFTFVKMALSENIVAIYDISEIIAQYDAGVRAKEGKF